MLAERLILAAAVVTCAAGCAANHEGAPAASASASASEFAPALAPAAPTAPQPTAHAAAEAIKAAVPEVTNLIAITEDNDANDMIGRVNGYIAATVLLDSRLTEDCDVDTPGIVCGAGIEQWPDEQAAQGRAEYIKSMLSAAPILGTEFQTVKGNLLLRVSGKLKPSAAEAYQTAFGG